MLTVVTEVILGMCALTNTEYDEWIQLVAVVVLAWSVAKMGGDDRTRITAFANNIATPVTLLICFNIIFTDHVDHWAHAAGGTVGIMLASGTLVGGCPRFDSLHSVATNGAIAAGAMAAFYAACSQACTEDTVGEEIVPTVNLLNYLKPYAAWINLDDVLGRGAHANVAEWVTLDHHAHVSH